jgi:hypothetical protein
MPSADEAVVCALRGKEKEKKEQRQHSPDDYNPYSEIDMAEFCEKAAPHWFEEKWGKCSDGNSLQLPPVPTRRVPETQCP